MGMQEGPRGNGWYTEYGVEKYEENQFDSEKADISAKRDIKDRFTVFTQNISYAVKFYREKILSQWDEPSDEAFLVLKTCIENSEVSDLKYEILYGNAYHILLGFMNYFQSFVYFMGLLSGFSLLRKNDKPYRNLFSCILIGGFIFQIIWEAKSRYILFYTIFLLPAAAYGFIQMSWAVRRNVHIDRSLDR
jgi:hypothetical protein